jgi:hypothetical protein
MLRALFPQAAFIPKERSLHATVLLHSAHLHSKIDALIDSGATDNFMSPTVVSQFKVPTYELTKPKVVRNVDGTTNSNGTVTKYAPITILHNGQTTAHTFYVIDLGEDHVLLGMPFLAATNPDIDWAKGAFKGTIIAAMDNAHNWTPHSQSKIREAIVDIPPGYHYYDTQLPRYINVRPEDYIFSSQYVCATNKERDLPEDYYSGDYITIQCTSQATELAAKNAKPDNRQWKEVIPREYHQYGRVFSKKAAYEFPPERPWDHAIELTPDAPATLNMKPFPLPLGRQKDLDAFIDEHL